MNQDDGSARAVVLIVDPDSLGVLMADSYERHHGLTKFYGRRQAATDVRARRTAGTAVGAAATGGGSRTFAPLCAA